MLHHPIFKRKSMSHLNHEIPAGRDMSCQKATVRFGWFRRILRKRMWINACSLNKKKTQGYSTWCNVIQCKICYTSGTNTFTFFILQWTKAELLPFFSSVSSAAILNFKMTAIFSLVLTSISSESTQNHISLMIFITYVCKNLLQI